MLRKYIFLFILIQFSYILPAQIIGRYSGGLELKNDSTFEFHKDVFVMPHWMPSCAEGSYSTSADTVFFKVFYQNSNIYVRDSIYYEFTDAGIYILKHALIEELVDVFRHKILFYRNGALYETKKLHPLSYSNIVFYRHDIPFHATTFYDLYQKMNYFLVFGSDPSN